MGILLSMMCNFTTENVHKNNAFTQGFPLVYFVCNRYLIMEHLGKCCT